MRGVDVALFPFAVGNALHVAHALGFAELVDGFVGDGILAGAGGAFGEVGAHLADGGGFVGEGGGEFGGRGCAGGLWDWVGVAICEGC